MKAFSGFLSFILLLLFSEVTVCAGELREIELMDGSVISGEVLSMTTGVYTVKTDGLGTMKLEESKIRAIRSKSTAGGSHKDGPSGSNSDVRSLKEEMMSSEEIMGMIHSLQNDPEFQKILEDPEVMRAVNAGDIPALIANPRFMKLLNNSTVQEIEKKLR